jgi:hypothetical protein
MVIQVKMRRTCTECKGDKPGCPKCGGTGWVEFWADLERLTESIRSGEPIVPAVNLNGMLDRFDSGELD